ncbi:PREDICTED: uncharacterized protein LOC105459605 [Wasmannia auropunctata]|uniref:uncharacterized protein LOC105459605 n=1 Tax=Wasmannia auropunctata TaxID=64793 RepID=UPI0005F0C112|nr:PREDICTED: uncharacterized protein LOC105459605 [Wasmannia auropunctata]
MPKEKRLRNYMQNIDQRIKIINTKTALASTSQQFNIPKSTLHSKFNNISSLNGKPGPPSILSEEEENFIKRWIFFCYNRGFPVKKDQLLDCVQEYIIKLNKKNPFTNNRPGRSWYNGFCLRHPELATKMAQNLSKYRADVTEEKLREWFNNELKTFLEQKELIDIEPSRVFSLDESAFFLSPKTDHVLVRKGSKSMYKIADRDENESLTVLLTMNAAGIMAPPMILFWYQKPSDNVISKIPQDWSVGTTEKGWMTSESFCEYITNVFHPWLVKNAIQFPVLLYINSHSPHITPSLFTFCLENKIELISLFPNATHILQPLDAVFNSLKQSWKSKNDQWKIHTASRLKKEDFAQLLEKAIENINLTEIVKKGFRTCGLLPFCSDAVNYSILNKNKRMKLYESTDECIESAEHCANQKEDEYKKFLEMFEEQLSKKVLRDFQNAAFNNITVSDIRNHGLFNMWLKIKKQCGNLES